MSLDIFVGPLSRYYAGEWQAPAGQASEEKVAPVRLGILAWRDRFTRQFDERGLGRLDWDETAQAPQFTGRPGWNGLAALILWAAYAEHPAVRPPAYLPEDWDNDAVLLLSTAAGARCRYDQLVRNVEIWLPTAFDFTLSGEDVAGRRIVFGSAAVLQRQLDDLNGATWKARRKLLEQWRHEAPSDGAPFEENARHAFAVLHDLVVKALEHRLPVKLGF